jgi:hypothetical protein
VVLIQSIVIFKKKGGYILKIITKLYVTRNDDTTSFCYRSLNNIGCDDDDDEEVESDDMEYTVTQVKKTKRHFILDSCLY